MIKRYIGKTLRNFYSNSQCKRFGSYGEDIFIEYKMFLINPGYLQVGKGCYFGPNCRIEAWDHYNNTEFKPQIIIGNNVKINSTCHIGAINSIRIGDDCLLGSHVMIIDHSHGNNSIEEISIHPSDRDLYSKGDIVIGDTCWLAENVVILPGVHIGNGCVIGASSVVTKNFPDNCVIAGNPARIVKRIE